MQYLSLWLSQYKVSMHVLYESNNSDSFLVSDGS